MEKMDLTEDKLKELKELAGLFFSPKNIAMIMEIDYSELKEKLQDENTEVYKSFNSGRLHREAEIRKSILEHASRGSAPAQTISVKFMEDSKLEDLI